MSSRSSRSSRSSLGSFLKPPGPREESPLTAQGSPSTIFRRALKSGNPVAAELSIREAGRITLAEALQFTARGSVSQGTVNESLPRPAAVLDIQTQLIPELL
jgi:hypothetical protein